jgi:hypothetical protein
MKNITITLDEKLAGQLRRHAAQHDVSVSRFIADLVQERMAATRAYSEAMRRFTSRPPARIKSAGERYPARTELHGRGRIR